MDSCQYAKQHCAKAFESLNLKARNWLEDVQTGAFYVFAYTPNGERLYATVATDGEYSITLRDSNDHVFTTLASGSFRDYKPAEAASEAVPYGHTNYKLEYKVALNREEGKPGSANAGKCRIRAFVLHGHDHGKEFFTEWQDLPATHRDKNGTGVNPGDVVVLPATPDCTLTVTKLLENDEVECLHFSGTGNHAACTSITLEVPAAALVKVAGY